jgi:hypothetical protein
MRQADWAGSAGALQADALHAQVGQGLVVGGGAEPAVGDHRTRRPTGDLDDAPDGGHQLGRVGWVALGDLVVSMVWSSWTTRRRSHPSVGRRVTAHRALRATARTSCTVCRARPATCPVSRSTSPSARPVRRRSVWASSRMRRPAARPRSRNRVLGATPRALSRRTSPPVVRIARSSRSASVGKSMSASTTVESTRSLRARSTRVWANLTSRAALSCSTVSGPARRTSLTRVIECGTGWSRPRRQNRRQPIESATSRHKLS